ncbi:hypothetical protein FACS1894110_01190 [Spirochaetia bacterium]|nr:hypothetical protein FACS1894110_01190 [Spirochaetia bacterium]
MNKCSLIQRREIVSLLQRADRILKSYAEASGRSVSVLDQNGHSVRTALAAETRSRGFLPGDGTKDLFFSELCKKHRAGPAGGDGAKGIDYGEHPCTGMRIDAVGESHRLGGSYIYMCPLGFIFWTSPIYSGGRRAGTLISGGVIGANRQEMSKKIYALCRKETTMDLIKKNLAEIPERSYEDIKALAQMMLICAEQISAGGENYNNTPAGLTEAESTDGIRLTRRYSTEGPPNLFDLPEKKRLLLAGLRRGDNGTAKKILNDIICFFTDISAGNFELFRIQAIELAVFLSRAAATQEISQVMMEVSDPCLKRINESKNTEDLIGILHIIIERLGGKIFSFRGIRHASALRKAERFIRENYTRKISLRKIADASGLSAPYFSTIFKEEMGENLSVYLNRLRVEKAAAMLTETETALCKISEACGFEDQSWFSKTFKNYMGLSPGKYRERGGPNLEHYAG